MDETAIREMKRFLWSCTKFLAALLCTICGVLFWFASDAFFVVVGYVLVALGLLLAVWTYDRFIQA